MTRASLLLIAALRRTAGGLLLLVGASFVIYITIRSAPGDAIDAISPMGTPPEVKAKLMAEFGLDRDPLTGYVAWLSRSAVGDFGESLVFAPGATVMDVGLPAFERTLALAGLALAACLVLALLGALLLGRPHPRQQLVTGPLYFVTAAPSFVVAVLFAQGMNWFVHTYVEQGGYETPPWYPIPIYSESWMPYLFAGIVLVAGDGQFTDFLNAVRAELQGLRNAQFIAAVRAKGARTVSHIARNMVVPLVSGYAARLPIVLGGVVIVEYIFTLDGAGYLLLEAARERDFPIVVGLSVLFTATIIVVNLLADIVRALVDPREVARGGWAERLGLWSSGAVVAVVLLLGVVAPFVAYDPASAVDYDQQLVGPSAAHWFGTDGQGRDVAIRLLKGIEAFFLPGLLAGLAATTLGALAGAIAGYAEGWVRSAVLGLMQLIDTLPRLVFIILVCTILNPSISLIAGVAAVLFVPNIATVVRRKVEALASEDYILAHIAHGFRPTRILLYHIIWLQCRPLLIRQATYVFGYVLFVETALSYLGDYGVQEPTPSWGNMVAQTRELAGAAPWPWLFPALAIVITISGFLAFGNLLARREEEALR